MKTGNKEKACAYIINVGSSYIVIRLKDYCDNIAIILFYYLHYALICKTLLFMNLCFVRF